MDSTNIQDYSGRCYELLKSRAAESLQSFSFSQCHEKNNNELPYHRIDFKCDNRMVSFEFSFHPLDYPYHLSITFSRNTEFCPLYWNDRYRSVPLHYYKKYVLNAEKDDPYLLVKKDSLVTIEEFQQVLQNALYDLDLYGKNFLNGDLSTFKACRKQWRNELRRLWPPRRSR